MEVFFYALPAQLYLEIITEKEFVGFVNSSEVVLSIPTAPLRRDRGKSPRKPMFSELRTPRKLCLRHNFRPPARSRRNARTTNNPAEVCPAGRNRRRSPAAFLAVPDGTMALARGGTPMVTYGRFRNSIKKYWRQLVTINH